MYVPLEPETMDEKEVTSSFRNNIHQQEFSDRVFKLIKELSSHQTDLSLEALETVREAASGQLDITRFFKIIISNTFSSCPFKTLGLYRQVMHHMLQENQLINMTGAENNQEDKLPKVMNEGLLFGFDCDMPKKTRGPRKRRANINVLGTQLLGSGVQTENKSEKILPETPEDNKREKNLRKPSRRQSAKAELQGESETSWKKQKTILVKDIPEIVKNRIRDMHGSEPVLVIQKILTGSDLTVGQGRLSIPRDQIITSKFLLEDEKKTLDKDEGIRVTLIGPHPFSEEEVSPVLKKWRMGKTFSYMLRSEWNQVWKTHSKVLKADETEVQLWCFRRGPRLCFYLVVVS